MRALVQTMFGFYPQTSLTQLCSAVHVHKQPRWQTVIAQLFAHLYQNHLGDLHLCVRPYTVKAIPNSLTFFSHPIHVHVPYKLFTVACVLLMLHLYCLHVHVCVVGSYINLIVWLFWLSCGAYYVDGQWWRFEKRELSHPIQLWIWFDTEIIAHLQTKLCNVLMVTMSASQK